MIFMMQELLRLFRDKVATKHFFIIAMTIAIMITTPCFQISSQVRKCVEFNRHVVNIDHPGIGTTISNKSSEQIVKSFKNLANVNYKDSIFYKYLAK